MWPFLQSSRNKEACLNIHNHRDNYCFAYNLLAWELAEKKKASTPPPEKECTKKGEKAKKVCAHENSVSRYVKNAPKGGKWPANFVPEFIDSGLDFSMLEFPVGIDDLEPFEEANKIHIYVYVWERGATQKAYPRRSRPIKEGWSEVCLMLVNKHWMWIKNFNRLMRLDEDTSGRGYHWCHRCTVDFRDNHGVSGKAKLAEHLKQARCCEDLLDAHIKTVLPKPKCELVLHSIP